jgi:hypothetical protein
MVKNPLLNTDAVKNVLSAQFPDKRGFHKFLEAYRAHRLSHLSQLF